jgi:hypothetical protein
MASIAKSYAGSGGFRDAPIVFPALELTRLPARFQCMTWNSSYKWTPEEDERLLQMAAAKRPRVLIGASLGRTSRAITRRLMVLRQRRDTHTERQSEGLPDRIVMAPQAGGTTSTQATASEDYGESRPISEAP